MNSAVNWILFTANLLFAVWGVTLGHEYIALFNAFAAGSILSRMVFS